MLVGSYDTILRTNVGEATIGVLQYVFLVSADQLAITHAHTTMNSKPAVLRPPRRGSVAWPLASCGTKTRERSAKKESMLVCRLLQLDRVLYRIGQLRDTNCRARRMSQCIYGTDGGHGSLRTQGGEDMSNVDTTQRVGESVGTFRHSQRLRVPSIHSVV